MRRAKIVATLGPASSEADSIRRLLASGADVLRLNLSHGSRDGHRETLSRVRAAAAELGRHVPVLMDLMGPRYRLGTLPDGGLELRRDEQVVIGAADDAPDLPVEEPELLEHLAPGERVLIDNGMVELKVDERRGRRVAARVVDGGVVTTRKGINLPDTDLPFTVSEKDREDIRMAVDTGADYLGASYVGDADDVETLCDLARRTGAEIPIVAKLERSRAIEHLDEIVAAAEAVMVARGDLGVEVPLHQVPVLQKRIVAAGRAHGKPVIVATQMLESMMERPRPTRAESSDVANAVFDGADALMLSGETAVGRYPSESVETMDRIIRESEAHDSGREGRSAATEPPPSSPWTDPDHGVADAVAAAAVFAARRLPVALLAVFSQSGFTTRLIGRYRPAAEIVAFTNDPAVARRAELVWGVRSQLLDEELHDDDDVLRLADRTLLAEGLAAPGDPVILLMGAPIEDRPLTNLMRVHRVRG